MRPLTRPLKIKLSEKKESLAVETLRKLLASIDDGINYEAENDRAYTKHFVALCKERKIIAKALKKLERIKR